MGITVQDFVIDGIAVSEVGRLSAAQTRWIVARLLDLGGVFFAVTPLPGDRFAIGVRPEWENTLLDIIRAERIDDDPREDRR